jgi:hypothetical protein
MLNMPKLNILASKEFMFNPNATTFTTPILKVIN